MTDTQTPVQRNGIIIFDLDGCVSDDRRRRSMLPATTINQTEGELDYSYYHMGLSEDPVLPHAMARIQDAQNNAAFIFFITARPISLFKESSEWIERNLGLARDLDYQLCMRPLGDTRPSPDLKRDIAKAAIAFAKDHNTHIIGAFDDRGDVVAMYRACGIPAWILDEDGTEAPFLKTVVPPEEIEDAELIEDGDDVGPDPDLADGPTQRPYVSDVTDGCKVQVSVPVDVDPAKTADQILMSMAEMFRLKNAQYDDNSVVVGRVMAALFPNGIALKTPADYEFWHLFELSIVKLTRFTQSKLRHQDSIHDQAIYLAMCERLVETHNIQIN